jgi:hypothetical protein
VKTNLEMRSLVAVRIERSGTRSDELGQAVPVRIRSVRQVQARDLPNRAHAQRAGHLLAYLLRA